MAMNESMKDLRKLSKVLCLQSMYYFIIILFVPLKKKKIYRVDCQFHRNEFKSIILAGQQARSKGTIPL